VLEGVERRIASAEESAARFEESTADVVAELSPLERAGLAVRHRAALAQLARHGRRRDEDVQALLR
jgi:hypothetical protein